MAAHTSACPHEAYGAEGGTQAPTHVQLMHTWGRQTKQPCRPMILKERFVALGTRNKLLPISHDAAVRIGDQLWDLWIFSAGAARSLSAAMQGRHTWGGLRLSAAGQPFLGSEGFSGLSRASSVCLAFSFAPAAPHFSLSSLSLAALSRAERMEGP